MREGVCVCVSVCYQKDDEVTYLLSPLASRLLCGDQGLVVGAPLSSEVDLGEGSLHQGHGQVQPIDVQPADEVACLVHAFNFYFHLGEEGMEEEEEEEESEGEKR